MVEDLIEKAKKLLANSYAPYSGIRVSAIVESNTGKTYSGVNVENASYGMTICAERSAISSMVTSGDRVIERIIIVTDYPEPIPPCGACGQVIAEFGKPDTLVVSHSITSDKTRVWLFKDLFPYIFTVKEKR